MAIQRGWGAGMAVNISPAWTFTQQWEPHQVWVLTFTSLSRSYKAGFASSSPPGPAVAEPGGGSGSCVAHGRVAPLAFDCSPRSPDAACIPLHGLRQQRCTICVFWRAACDVFPLADWSALFCGHSNSFILRVHEHQANPVVLLSFWVKC